MAGTGVHADPRSPHGTARERRSAVGLGNGPFEAGSWDNSSYTDALAALSLHSPSPNFKPPTARWVVLAYHPLVTALA